MPTTGTDDIAGTARDDIFNAPLDAALGGLAGQQTLQGFDVLDGGAGYDQLNAELNMLSGFLGGNNPTIQNIEQYNLTASGGSFLGGGYLDLSRASGYEVLQNIDSRADVSLDFVNLMANGAAPEIWLTNVVGNGTETDIDYDADVGVIAVQNVVANKVGSIGTGNYRLDIDFDGPGWIDTLNLDVSNGVYLHLDDAADRILHLNITGSGLLGLEGHDDFPDLVSLDSRGYTGDLNLNVEGFSTSSDLLSVLTGIGNDRVIINHNAVTYDALTDVGLHVDMGLGENVLALAHVWDEDDINPMNFGGGIVNVQTLEFIDDIDLDANAHLNLTGFDGNLSTLLFDGDFDGNGFNLEITSPNENVNIVSRGDDFEDVTLTTVGVKNLTIDVNGVDFLGNPVGELEILNVGGAGLETFHAKAVEDATVTIDTTPANDVGSLASVSVTSTTDDAYLKMNGNAGQPFVAGTQQVQVFDIAVTRANLGGFPTSYRSTGEITLASSVFATGFETIPYSTTTSVLYTSNAWHTQFAINDIVAYLNGLNLGFTASGSGGELQIQWDDVGVQPDFAVVPAGTHNTQAGASLSFAEDPLQKVPGVDDIAMEYGDGFEALTDVLVVAMDADDGDADVELTDVYGGEDGLTVDVTATDNAWIDLYNTGVTSVTAAAAHVDIDAAGDTVGNSLLTTISVTSVSADITLADNLVSFDTLDVLNVSDYLVADTSGADFGSMATGDFITYTIGATSDGIDGTIDVNFTGNAVREVYNFAGGDIGEVVITDFTWGADPTTGDRLDLSAFASNAGQLVFSDVGADLVITDLAGGFNDFGGSITIIGAAGDGAELAQFNILYAESALG